MKLNTNIKKILIEIVSLLYVVLFIYAAVSKLIDFENFKVQLGQSPLLSAFATPVAIGVPVLEIVIAVMLLLPKLKLYGLLSGFTLMVMFTAYIYIILNFSQFIPCSCGGVLEKMTWNQHLIFNLSFVLLAGLAILFQPEKKL
ncbi:MauE/DoxX family redox-associated membrane protein [Flavobacterium luminosum]|uniref:Methylamine utilisation protein MauE domain-containing protein n=1 Tax=Flavobacterium luminosum TaxID=2949086 RepID=A0ABT0TQT3_9FLAO|nr:MauE/DoxX family redox-associated membrane protein [Flavobacterium sp. HXWNR70]MCL9809853.1 hypothetical protein [Flavobacterium sp. HXWNR70]